MRRDTAASAAIVLSLGAWSCGGNPPTPSPSIAPDCRHIAKVTVTLTGTDGACKAEVAKTEERVCVFRGGAVRWKVHNRCRPLVTGERPAFEIADLKHKKDKAAPTWSFEGCSTRIDEIPVDEAPSKGKVLLCGVPEDAAEGLYKYDIRGAEIETLDPDVEVRRGGGGQ